MKEAPVRFALIGDCHYSSAGNYGTRDCLGAKKRLEETLRRLNRRKLDFVVALGDLGDGRDPGECPEMLEVFRRSRHPVHFVIGNHDLVQRTADEHARLAGMPAPFYDFAVGPYRFIVLNAFEQSRYCPEGSEERRAYDAFRREHPWLLVQDWPGLMTEASWTKLSTLLDQTRENGEEAVLISHVPCWYDAAHIPSMKFSLFARIPDYQRMLDLIDRYPNIRACFAGHYHPGRTTLRKGVLHKTVRALSDSAVPTACIVSADRRAIHLEGLGEETAFLHDFDPKPCRLSGTAPEGCFVMTNCGEIQRVGASGRFSLPVPAPGMYAIRAVMDGCKDTVLPRLQAPARGLKISFESDPSRKLHTGNIGRPALLHITDDGSPVRWFDVAGTPYGSVEPEEGVWHEHSRNYWTNGRYAFTARGDVSLRVLPRHPQLREAGWYKGDLHAHLIHGENLYIGNVQQAAFIARAEGYDWLYLTYRHGNDGSPCDAHTLAKQLSAPDLWLGLNQEYPKSRSNHCGNAGVEAPTVQADMSKISSVELAEAAIWSRGGVTVPVHPFEEHMSFRELCLWLLCVPEQAPCIDFFYHDNTPKSMAEDYWFMLLNRGWHIGCFATSDASFDVGRTPGSDRGTTYLYLDGLNEASIVEAVRRRRAMVSWDCAALVCGIDDAICGDLLPADGSDRTLNIRALWQKERRGTLRIVRNGKDVFRAPVSFTEDEQELKFEYPVRESEDCWYVVMLESDDGRVRSVASPFRFRTPDFRPPETLPLPRPCPEELLAECEQLTPEELARPELLDIFADKLRRYAQK